MFEWIFKVYHYHPEIIAVAMSMLFALSQARIIEFLFYQHSRKIHAYQKRAITAAHVIASSFLYSVIIWKLLDHGVDSMGEIVIISLGFSFVSAMILVFWKEIWSATVLALSAIKNIKLPFFGAKK